MVLMDELDAATATGCPPLSKTGEVAGGPAWAGGWGAPSPGFAGTSPMLRMREES
jgi:hypothetical protein